MKEMGPAETEGAFRDISRTENFRAGSGQWTADPEGNPVPSGSQSRAEYEADRPSLNPEVTDPGLKATYAAAAESPLTQRGAGWVADSLAMVQRAKLWSQEGAARQKHVEKLKAKGMSHEDALTAMKRHWEQTGKSKRFQAKLTRLGG